MPDPIDAPHETTLRVRYEETDAGGIVYHGKYFEYFEVGRTEWLRARGLAYRDLESRGVRLVVAQAEARYHVPLRYDDCLIVRTRIVELRRASIDFRYEILRESTRIAEGRTVLVSVGPDGRPTRLPEEIVALGGG